MSAYPTAAQKRAYMIQRGIATRMAPSPIHDTGGPNPQPVYFEEFLVDGHWCWLSQAYEIQVASDLHELLRATFTP